MNIYLLCIGSNTSDKESRLHKCQAMLTQSFENIIFSPIVESDAYGGENISRFCNQLARIKTAEDLSYLRLVSKQIERILGRTNEDKLARKVVIDIDIIQYNNDILKPEDYNRDYVQKLLNSFSEEGKN